MENWNGSLTRLEAIRILDRATDKDDPHWEYVIQDWYDEATDTWPTIQHCFAALGVTEQEFKEAANVDNANWPTVAE